MSNKFKTSILALSISSILSTSTVYAAEDTAADKIEVSKKEADTMEIVTINGIRGSQQRSLQAKRYASSIVDSISSEDIGKFPDQNISESLQRVPGITISRVAGEGQQVTVRGMGPEHTTVLLNGRVLATENEGREFNFDVLASELMTAVDVYKTPTASLEEGGIGSTINMKTARPMQYDGFQAVASVKTHYDENSGQASPQFSGLASNVFMDGKFGILASLNYYKHEFRSNRVFTDGYEHFQSSNFSLLSQARRDELSVFDGDGYGEGIAMATWYQEDIDSSSRKRIGGTLVVQYQANDDLLFTVDGIYSKLDVNSRAFGPAKWLGPDYIDDVTLDNNGTVVGWHGTTDWGGTENWSFSRPRYAETKQIGFNVDWYVNEQFKVVFDASYSTAASTPIGREVIVNILSEQVDMTMTQAPGDIIPSYSFTNGNAGNLSTLKPNWSATEGTDLNDTAKSVALDTTYELKGDSIVIAVLAGISLNHREKIKIRAGTGDGGIVCGVACDSNGGFYPSNLFSAYDASDYFSGGSAYPNWILPDFDAITDILDDSPGYVTKVRPRESGTVKEETYGGYIQANLEGDLGDLPWSGNLGIRYAQTDVASIGENEELLSVDKTNPEEPVGVFSEPTAISDLGNYGIWLPSANFKLDLQQDLALRAAIGKTITRPTLSLLQLKREWNLRPNDRVLVIGNPSLEPLVAWNYDLNLTWYIDEASYASAAIFYKELSNDWHESRTTQTFFGDVYTIISKENLGKGNKTGYELAAQYTLSQLPEPFNGLGLSANYTKVTSQSDGDEEADDDSTSYNFALFYEHGLVQARVVYNFRDGYLAGLNANRGQPRMIDDYGQWDIQASYEITDDLSLFAEGINMTNEKTFSYQIYKNRPIELKDTGRRYSVGLRYQF